MKKLPPISPVVARVERVLLLHAHRAYRNGTEPAPLTEKEIHRRVTALASQSSGGRRAETLPQVRRALRQLETELWARRVESQDNEERPRWVWRSPLQLPPQVFCPQENLTPKGATDGIRS